MNFVAVILDPSLHRERHRGRARLHGRARLFRRDRELKSVGARAEIGEFSGELRTITFLRSQNCKPVVDGNVFLQARFLNDSMPPGLGELPRSTDWQTVLRGVARELFVK